MKRFQITLQIVNILCQVVCKSEPDSLTKCWKCYKGLKKMSQGVSCMDIIFFTCSFNGRLFLPLIPREKEICKMYAMYTKIIVTRSVSVKHYALVRSPREKHKLVTGDNSPCQLCLKNFVVAYIFCPWFSKHLSV